MFWDPVVLNDADRRLVQRDAYVVSDVETDCPRDRARPAVRAVRRGFAAARSAAARDAYLRVAVLHVARREPVLGRRPGLRRAGGGSPGAGAVAQGARRRRAPRRGGPADRRAAGGAGGHAQPRARGAQRPAPRGRAVAAVEGRAGPGHAGRADRDHGAADRGVRHRQGGGGALHPPRFAPQRRALHRHQLRGAARPAARIGAVRPRARRVHRRRHHQARPHRAGQRRRAVPGRGRRDGDGGSGQAAARARGARVHAAGRQQRHPRGSAPHRRHQPQPAGCDRTRRVSRGPLLPPERVRDHAAAAARADRRHPGAGRLVPRRDRRERRPAGRGHRAGRQGTPAGLRLAGQRPRAAQRDRARRDPGRWRPDSQPAPAGLERGARVGTVVADAARCRQAAWT